MATFEKEEAFEFIKGFLEIKNPEERMQSDRKALLDEILCSVQTHLPFHNLWLMSFPPSERRPTTPEEAKTNFTSGFGGVCFDLNISTFHLLTAVGFDVLMVHASVSSTIAFPNNHISLLINSVERDGDQFFADPASGYPTFRAINLDFEKESPVFVDSFLEYKLVKYEGKLLRMHRKGDMLASRGRQENSILEFWLDDWRRFYTAELKGTKDTAEFSSFNEIVHIDPTASPFHHSHRVVTFTGGKAAMVVNDKTLIENEKGNLVSTVLGSDEEIMDAIKKICPAIPEELLTKSLQHWREISNTSR